MSLDDLIKEIEHQNTWSEKEQKNFIQMCLKSQGGIKRAKKTDVERVFQAFRQKDLHDESIQYYVRIYLEMVYQIN